MTHRDRWQDRWFTGHVNLGPLTIFGANAMHWTVQLRTPRGYLCFRPTTRSFGGYWPWKLYWSPNATPWAMRWGIGPGIDSEDKRACRLRRMGECHCAVSNMRELCPSNVHAVKFEVDQFEPGDTGGGE